MAATQADSEPPRKTFEELARELECDEDEDAFEATVKRVATVPKPPEPDGGKPD